MCRGPVGRCWRCASSCRGPLSGLCRRCSCRAGAGRSSYGVFSCTPNGGQRNSNLSSRVNRRSDFPHNGTIWDSTVYYSRIGDRLLGYMKKLRRTLLHFPPRFQLCLSLSSLSSLSPPFSLFSIRSVLSVLSLLSPTLSHVLSPLLSTLSSLFSPLSSLVSSLLSSIL